MRKIARLDDNQKEIVKKLRGCGVSVQSLAQMGNGVPDLLLGWKGYNILVEVKDGNKTESKRKLTDDEKNWHQNWKGTVYVAKSFDEIITILNDLT